MEAQRVDQIIRRSSDPFSVLLLKHALEVVGGVAGCFDRKGTRVMRARVPAGAPRGRGFTGEMIGGPEVCQSRDATSRGHPPNEQNIW